MIEYHGQYVEGEGCYVLVRDQHFRGRIDHSQAWVFKDHKAIKEFLKYHGRDWDNSTWRIVAVNFDLSYDASYLMEGDEID